METKDPALTKTPIMDSSLDNNDVDSKSLAEKTAMTREEEFHDSRHEVETNTTVNKGTDTFEEGVVGSEHVNDGDNPARQPDRRDQEGNAFDENINEDTVRSEAPKSEGITDMNRYANIDNAQTRTLNPDEKD